MSVAAAPWFEGCHPARRRGKRGRCKPRDRCVGLALEDWDAHWASRSRLPRRTIRIFTRRVCVRADEDAVLREDGAIPRASARALGNVVAIEMRSERLLP